jgi:hypothetical protein
MQSLCVTRDLQKYIQLTKQLRTFVFFVFFFSVSFLMTLSMHCEENNKLLIFNHILIQLWVAEALYITVANNVVLLSVRIMFSV